MSPLIFGFTCSALLSFPFLLLPLFDNFFEQNIYITPQHYHLVKTPSSHHKNIIHSKHHRPTASPQPHQHPQVHPFSLSAPTKRLQTESRPFFLLRFQPPPTTVMPDPVRALNRPAKREDAIRIADIHLLAMQSNPLLHAQFPTPESKAALRYVLAQEALVRLGPPYTNNKSMVCCPLGGEDDDIVGFISWDEPSPRAGLSGSPPQDNNKKMLEEGESMQNIPGCRKEYLDEYARLAKEAKQRSGFGEKRCWRKFLHAPPLLPYVLSDARPLIPPSYHTVHTYVLTLGSSTGAWQM